MADETAVSGLLLYCCCCSLPLLDEGETLEAEDRRRALSTEGSPSSTDPFRWMDLRSDDGVRGELVAEAASTAAVACKTAAACVRAGVGSSLVGVLASTFPAMASCPPPACWSNACCQASSSSTSASRSAKVLQSGQQKPGWCCSISGRIHLK